MYIRESHTDFMQLFYDEIKVYKLEADGSNCTCSLNTPVLVKRIDGSSTVQTQCVSFQLRQVIKP